MYLLFDIGGSLTRISFTKDLNEFADPVIYPTPSNFEEAMNTFSEKARAFGDGFVKAVGGIRGVLDENHKVLLNDAHLTNWLNKPLAKSLEELVKCEFIVENDTSIVGLGEAFYGAGKGYSHVSYMTVSTGVGGARIVNGKIDKGLYAFEPGHMTIDADATISPSGGNEIDHPGNLEALVSGSATSKKFGKHPSEVTDSEHWQGLSKLVAVGVSNMIVHWSPEVVVLGGGMMGEPGISVEEVRIELQKHLKIYPTLPKIEKAQLGDIGGIWGSMAYLNSQISDKSA